MAASTKSRQTVAHKKNNTNNRKKTYRQTPQPKKNVRKDTGIAKEASVLIAFALSVIFFIANFGVGGMVGAAISSFFFGLFGLVAYIFPILLFGGTLFMISNKGNSIARVKFIAGVLVMILICVLIQLISGSHADEWTFTQYYTESSAGRHGGGFFGGSICKLFVTWFGTVGAYLIDIVLVIIGIVVITERSFIGGIRKGSRKVYDAHKNHEREREENPPVKRVRIKNEPHEKVPLTRASRKAYGVTFDTEIKDGNMGHMPDLSLTSARKKPEAPVFRFEAAPDDETIDDNVLDYEAAHYTEEQSNPFDVFDGEEEYIPETDDVDAGPEEIPDDIITEEYIEPEEVKIVEPEPVRQTPATEHNEVQRPQEIKPARVKKSTGKYVFPPLNLLSRDKKKSGGTSNAELKNTASQLQQTLANFGVKVKITDVSCGPTVTRYELSPEQGVKVSKIVSLADDIKLNLAAADIRIEAPIPGKSAVGIEVPNKETTGVMLGDLIASPEFKQNPSPISFAVGKDIAGKVVVANIAKMPHVLIAGATGSGKSVCINSIIMSILYKAHPDDVKLIMVDPKVVELSVYNGIPHLLIPVVTDPKKAAGALNWAVAEMTDRYQKFSQFGVRNLKGYNEKIESMEESDDENKPAKMPHIVIIIDELADLMMVSSNEVEDAIVRLAQLARAAGIHMVIATQRPSVNVITGLIKANVPSRIAFSVSSGVDSRTIIDMNGAEKLLGKGDMLYFPSNIPKPIRVQGAFVSDEEVSRVVDFLKENMTEEAKYDESIADTVSQKMAQGLQTEAQDDKDSLFADAARFVIEKEKGSIGMLQRQFKIGFNRAGRIMDQLSDAGVVGPEIGTKPRKVLMSAEEFESYMSNN